MKRLQGINNRVAVMSTGTATSVLDLTLEGAAVCLNLGKPSSFHAFCQASKKVRREMEKYSDLELM